MKISQLALAVTLSFSAALANASTILFPTDGDVNFFGPSNFIESGFSLAIFDDSEAVASGAQITSSTGMLVVNMTDGTFVDGGVIDFLGNVGVGGAYQASNQVVLFDFVGSNDDFIVGLSTDGGATWFADTGFTGNPGNSGVMTFNVAGETFLVDVQSVPVPAAVWLFGSGLLGLVGVARRRA